MGNFPQNTVGNRLPAGAHEVVPGGSRRRIACPSADLQMGYYESQGNLRISAEFRLQDDVAQKTYCSREEFRIVRCDIPFRCVV